MGSSLPAASTDRTSRRGSGVGWAGTAPRTGGGGTSRGEGEDGTAAELTPSGGPALGLSSTGALEAEPEGSPREPAAEGGDLLADPVLTPAPLGPLLAPDGPDPIKPPPPRRTASLSSGEGDASFEGSCAPRRRGMLSNLARLGESVSRSAAPPLPWNAVVLSSGWRCPLPAADAATPGDAALSSRPAEGVAAFAGAFGASCKTSCESDERWGKTRGPLCSVRPPAPPTRLLLLRPSVTAGEKKHES